MTSICYHISMDFQTSILFHTYLNLSQRHKHAGIQHFGPATQKPNLYSKNNLLGFFVTPSWLALFLKYIARTRSRALTSMVAWFHQTNNFSNTPFWPSQRPAPLFFPQKWHYFKSLVHFVLSGQHQVSYIFQIVSSKQAHRHITPWNRCCL